MARRVDIMNYLNEMYLKEFDIEDYCHNGLQIEGKDEVENIVIGVSFSKRLVESAIEKDAKMIICHHGLFSMDISNPPVIAGFLKDRLKLVLENEINLVGYHLPMDAHREYGHNSLACKYLGLKNIEKCHLGYIGDLVVPKHLDNVVLDVEEMYGRKVDVFAFGKSEIKRIAVISGGASAYWQKPVEMGADLYITGEMAEHMVRKYEEMGLNVICAGHYHSERLGVIKLAELLSDKFDVNAEFVEIETYV